MPTDLDQVCAQAMHAFGDYTIDMGPADVGEGVFESNTSILIPSYKI